MKKRIFDIFFSSIFLLLVLLPLIFFLFLAAVDTRSTGLFFQKRIGQYGNSFTIFKLRSYHKSSGLASKFGKWMRTYKIDEIPQLLNVLIGNMSLVGPRPDLEGYYDLLQDEERLILNLKPGITGPATLKYQNETFVLEQLNEEDRLVYNDEIIFPDKVKINLEYYRNNSVKQDLLILWKTLIKVLFIK